MLIRYASHYLLFPEYGFFKQYVIEVKEEYIVRVFPLLEESEAIEWQPGVILFIKEEEDKPLRERINQIFQHQYDLLKEMPDTFLLNGVSKQRIYSLYPFDFKKMMPTDETEIRECNDTVLELLSYKL
jgi:hypothetical protein